MTGTGGGTDRPDEVVLVGGTANRGLIMRRGDAVHRPPGPHAASVHALLTYLDEVGFDGAPRFLGMDEQGREVLSFIPGDAVVPPYAPWMFSDDTLRSVARLLRRYHEAVADFDLAPWRWSRPPPRSSAVRWPAIPTRTWPTWCSATRWRWH